MTADRPLRVLHIVPDLATGGAERHVTTLFTELDRDRFAPSVVCIGDEGALFGALRAADVPAVALHRRRREAPRALLELVRHLRATRPDLVLVRGYSAETLGRLAAFLTRTPVVVWVHNCGDDGPRGRLRRLLDRALAPVTAAWFAVAHNQVGYLTDELRCPPGRITVVHNGVDPSRFDPRTDRTALTALGIEPDRPAIGILAALRPEKDHATLLHAARSVLATHPRAVFVVVGDGPERAGLERLAAGLGLGDSVVFVGNRADPRPLLRGLDVFVLCSYTIECFPMALLEAMAAGRAAVCTDVGGTSEIVDDGRTGHLVPPRDPAQLAERIGRLLDDPGRAARMGRAARRRIEEEFTLRRSVAAAEDAFTDVLAGRVRPLALDLVLDETGVGGAEILMLETFRRFDPGRVRPRVICLRRAGPLAADFRAAGIDVEVLDRAGRSDPRTLPRLIRSFRRNGTDAVLVTHHQRAALALGRAAALLARVPVNLVAAHDMDLTRVGSRCLPRWAVGTLFVSDALILLTAAQGRYLRRDEGVGASPLSRIREVVIPNGIDVADAPTVTDRRRARAMLGLDEDVFTVGIVARLTAQKAHEVLFAAVAGLVAAGRPVALVVIGGGPRQRELQELAGALGIGTHVTFTGVRRDVAALLPGLDVACLSSVHEGVPVTVLEAMAAGLPVVSTDCGSLRDLVDDGVHGYLVPVGDSAAMSRRLAALADDPALRARQGRAARARAVAEFSIERTARGYERLLEETVIRR